MGWGYGEARGGGLVGGLLGLGMLHEHTEGELCAETGTHIRISAGTLSSPPLINIPLLCGLVMSEVLVGRASDGAGTRAFEG